MALDDICTCSHEKRFHVGASSHNTGSYNGACQMMSDAETGPAQCPCSEFADRFAIPSTIDDTDDIALGGFLADIKAQLADLAASFAPLQEQHAEVKAELDDLNEKRRIAAEKANLIENAMRSAKKLMDKAERAAELAERNITQARILKQRQEELKTMASEFDRLTMGAPWREWAFPYQLDDAKVAALAKRCIIGNTMGTGKTLISQIVCDMIKSERVIIFTPASVMRTFVKEIERWSPHRDVILMGGMTRVERRAEINVLNMLKARGEGFTVVLNYEAMRKDNAFNEDLKRLEFDTIILDEAHSFKDKKSLTFRQVKELVNGDGHQIPNVFPMTGTPILNKPQDLWPLLNIIDPYGFSDEYYFLRQYCTQDWDSNKWKFTTTGLNGLQRKLRDKFIRRTKNETGIELPEKTIQVHDITLDPMLHPKQFAANRALNEQAAIFLDDGRATAITTVLALITRKRQMMTLPSGIKWMDTDKDSPTYNTPIFQCDVEESVKLDYIIRPNGDADNPSWDDAAGLLPELCADEKVVVFSQFKAPLHRLCADAIKAGIHAAVIDGDTPMERRQEIIDAFQDKAIGTAGSIDVIFGNFKALGVGVTLHAASQMIILDEEWNPGKNEQAYDRIHRIGQSKAVTIHILRVENSVDEWMAQIIEDKAALVDGFNATVPVSSTDLLEKLKGGML